LKWKFESTLGRSVHALRPFFCCRSLRLTAFPGNVRIRGRPKRPATTLRHRAARACSGEPHQCPRFARADLRISAKSGRLPCCWWPTKWPKRRPPRSEERQRTGNGCPQCRLLQIRLPKAEAHCRNPASDESEPNLSHPPVEPMSKFKLRRPFGRDLFLFPVLAHLDLVRLVEGFESTCDADRPFLPRCGLLFCLCEQRRCEVDEVVSQPAPVQPGESDSQDRPDTGPPSPLEDAQRDANEPRPCQNPSIPTPLRLCIYS